LWRERTIWKKEEERIKKESRSNRYRHKSAILCHKGVMEVGVIPVNVTGLLVQLDL
jgi:hypothetical protein